MADQALWQKMWAYIPAHHGSDANSPVPDDHLNVHDPDGYVPGEDRTVQARSILEQTRGITRGIRYMYDPALGMPYEHATAKDLLSDNTDHATRALRVREIAAVTNSDNNVVVPKIRQILPPLPRLPVCPGLLYFGDKQQ